MSLYCPGSLNVFWKLVSYCPTQQIQGSPSYKSLCITQWLGPLPASLCSGSSSVAPARAPRCCCCPTERRSSGLSSPYSLSTSFLSYGKKSMIISLKCLPSTTWCSASRRSRISSMSLLIWSASPGIVIIIITLSSLSLSSSLYHHYHCYNHYIIIINIIITISSLSPS